MTSARSAYDRCTDLFAAYPLAVQCADWAGTLYSMVLIVGDGDNADFFTLARDDSEGTPFYSLVPWRPDGPLVDIEADSGAVSEAAVIVLRQGVPLPRHGSLFGWLSGNEVTALVAVYTDYAPEYPEPSWAVMPLVGAPAWAWPPFTREQLFGSWFWEHYHAGTMVSLATLIAANPGTAFWVDSEAELGWNCCVVSRDIISDAGYVVPRGCYLYYGALQRGVDVPPPDTLLAGPGKTDIAPRLRSLADAEQRAQELRAGQGLYELPSGAHNLPHYGLPAAPQSVAWRGAGGSVVGARRGGRGRLLPVVLVLWLIRWSLLRGEYQRREPPGTDEPTYIHVVCPRDCGNEWWVRAFSEYTVRKCNCPGDDRVPMVRCTKCAGKPRLHPPPAGWRPEGRQ